MTHGPVNLNRYRKTKARAEKKARADRNAVMHGLPKADRDKARAKARNSVKELDGKVMETPHSSSDPDPESP